MTNSQLLNFYVIRPLWNVFCLSSFFTKQLDHLPANPGCMVLPACQQLCQITSTEGRTCLCIEITSTAEPTNPRK